MRIPFTSTDNRTRHGNSVVAEITPQEAALLHLLGGVGSINPRTGRFEFDAEGIGGPGDTSPGESDSGRSDGFTPEINEPDFVHDEFFNEYPGNDFYNGGVPQEHMPTTPQRDPEAIKAENEAKRRNERAASASEFDDFLSAISAGLFGEDKDKVSTVAVDEDTGAWGVSTKTSHGILGTIGDVASAVLGGVPGLVASGVTAAIDSLAGNPLGSYTTTSFTATEEKELAAEDMTFSEAGDGTSVHETARTMLGTTSETGSGAAISVPAFLSSTGYTDDDDVAFEFYRRLLSGYRKGVAV